MQCPNDQCGSRVLRLYGEADATILFTETGTVDHITYGEWSLTEDSDVSCDACDWTGSYRHCAEAGDTLPLVPGQPPAASDPHLTRLIEILEGQAALVVALRDIPEQYLDVLVRLRRMERTMNVLTNAVLKGM